MTEYFIGFGFSLVLAENITCHCGRWCHAHCEKQTRGIAHQWAIGYYLRLLPGEQMTGQKCEFLKDKDSYGKQ